MTTFVAINQPCDRCQKVSPEVHPFSLSETITYRRRVIARAWLCRKCLVIENDKWWKSKSGTRLAAADAAMVAAHNALVEWYVQDQADVIGVVGAVNAAHRMVEAVKLIDAWLGRCPWKEIANA